MNVQNILFDIAWVVEVLQRNELWMDSLKRCSNYLTHAFTAVVLVKKSECVARLKGPKQQGIQISLHDDEKQGQMSFFTHSVPVQVCTDAHFVSRTRAGERRAVN